MSTAVKQITTKVSSLKQQTLIISSAFACQESGSCVAGCLGSISHEVEGYMLAGAGNPPRPDWVRASAPGMLGPGCWRRTSASCWHWWEALFPDHGDLPRGYFNVQPPRQPASPQGSERRGRVVEEGNALHSPLRGHTVAPSTRWAHSARPALEGRAVAPLLLKGSVSKCLWTDL